MDSILWTLLYYGLYTMEFILWILYYGLYIMGSTILWSPVDERDSSMTFYRV